MAKWLVCVEGGKGVKGLGAEVWEVDSFDILKFLYPYD